MRQTQLDRLGSFFCDVVLLSATFVYPTSSPEQHWIKIREQPKQWHSPPSSQNCQLAVGPLLCWAFVVVEPFSVVQASDWPMCYDLHGFYIASALCVLLLSLLNQPICAIACEPNVVKVPVECTRKAMKSPPAATCVLHDEEEDEERRKMRRINFF